MKNVHILPTTPNDETAGGVWIKETRDWCNIYITNDEKIKEGDWLLSKEGIVHNNWGWNFGDKKIILTTDQDLIKDGIQPIDDEFLEWFVNNSSCEEVEVNYLYEYPNVKHIGYKIIIPKEEQKLEKIVSKEPSKFWEESDERVKEQETLEEAADKYSKKSNTYVFQESHKRDFISGAKWQAERMCNHTYILTSEQGHRVIKCQKCYDTQPI